MLGAVESWMVTSALNANMRGRPMPIDALNSPEQTPAVPQTRARTTDANESMFVSLAPARRQVTPHHRAPTRSVDPPPAAHQDIVAPATYAAAGSEYYAIPSSSHRKLSIRKFYRTKLFKGLGSGLYDRGRTFLRAVKFAESSWGFA